MRFTRKILTFMAAAVLLAGNEPQTTLRSVVNGVSFQPALATVARGGILTVFGEQLASAHTVAEGLPLPVSLEDPAVDVLINGVSAPLFFVSPTQINAQVPWEIETGRAEVVVRRGGTESATMPVVIADAALSLIRHAGSSAPIAQSAAGPQDPAAAPSSGSFALELGSPGSRPSATGEALDPSAAIAAADTIVLFGVGVGETTPAMANGSAGVSDEAYTFATPQRAYFGGIPVSDPTAEVSTELVGVYKMTLTVPELAGSTEVFHWVSGGQASAGVLGPVGASGARYMPIPDGAGSAERIDRSDLNPYYVVVSAAIDEAEGCYSGFHLLDFRRGSTTSFADCLLPSYPNAVDPGRSYRPFEAATNSPVLAALVSPEEDPQSGATDRLLLMDSAADTTAFVTLASATDRLQPGEQGGQNLRLERSDGTGTRDVIDFSGTVVGESDGLVNLPSPLQAGELTRVVAQGNANFAGGYRLRFLAPESPDEAASTKTILFDRSASVLTQAGFPDGWAPISPPRRTNAQGNPVGGSSLAPVATGFAGNTTAYVLARKTDGTQDGVVAFRLELPEESPSEGELTTEEGTSQSVSITVAVTPFPSGLFAANCHTQVRWQRIPLTHSIAIAGAAEALNDFADPRADNLCASDRLVLFDTRTAEIRSVAVPSAGEGTGKLDVASKGALSSYLYFGDGARETALKASGKLHVFDGVSESFSEIALPDGAGLPFNNFLTQQLPASGLLVALATGGNARTTGRGTLPPFPGNRGLLVIDLPGGTATQLTLPEGLQRAIPGTNRMVQDGRRMFGVIPLLGRAFGVFRRPNNPGGSAVVTWDVATGTATEIALPENGYSVVQPFTSGGGGAAPFIWDYSAKTASFAFGVYDQGGSLISIGIVGP